MRHESKGPGALARWSAAALEEEGLVPGRALRAVAGVVLSAKLGVCIGCVQSALILYLLRSRRSMQS